MTRMNCMFIMNGMDWMILLFDYVIGAIRNM